MHWISEGGKPNPPTRWFDFVALAIAIFLTCLWARPTCGMDDNKPLNLKDGDVWNCLYLTGSTITTVALNKWCKLNWEYASSIVISACFVKEALDDWYKRTHPNTEHAVLDRRGASAGDLYRTLIGCSLAWFLCERYKAPILSVSANSITLTLTL